MENPPIAALLGRRVPKNRKEKRKKTGRRTCRTKKTRRRIWRKIVVARAQWDSCCCSTLNYGEKSFETTSFLLLSSTNSLPRKKSSKRLLLSLATPEHSTLRSRVLETEERRIQENFENFRAAGGHQGTSEQSSCGSSSVAA